MCGIRNKIIYPEFKSLINDYDIICFTETKLDDLDNLESDDFLFRYKNRKKVATYKSGGIAIGYKKCLHKFIKPIETDCQYVYWLNIDKQLFNLSQNVIIGVIYIPPVNSLYSSDEVYTEIELELQRFFQTTKNIILTVILTVARQAY